MPDRSPATPLRVPAGTRVVLASSSPYRAAVLAEAGIDAVLDPPAVDERAADHLLVEGAEVLALHLARAKAAAVASRHPGAWVLAADQVAVLERAGEAPRMLTKQPTTRGAVEQLLAMSGRTHRLVNGVVVTDADPDRGSRRVEGVGVVVVRMRRFGEAAARAYVERFEPFDSAGSYRIEDDDAMAPAERLIEEVVGEDRSGVLGLPLALLSRLFAELAATTAGAATTGSEIDRDDTTGGA